MATGRRRDRRPRSLGILAVASAMSASAGDVAFPRFPGLTLAPSPPPPPWDASQFVAMPPPPYVPDGVHLAGHRCGNPHRPLDMFIDNAADCQRIVYASHHDSEGTMEFFSWSAYTLYCYGCARSEVEDGAAMAEPHYNVYEVFSPPFYDPVRAFADAHIAGCFDTPGWHDSEYRSCDRYASERWCVDGFVEWPEVHGGHKNHDPEENCCVCGGGSDVAPAPSPPPSDHPLACVDLVAQVDTPTLFVTPGSELPGQQVHAWRDAMGKSCKDYELKAWCAESQVLSPHVAGLHNNNPEAACCICGGGVHKRVFPPPSAPPLPPPGLPPPVVMPPPTWDLGLPAGGRDASVGFTDSTMGAFASSGAGAPPPLSWNHDKPSPSIHVGSSVAGQEGAPGVVQGGSHGSGFGMMPPPPPAAFLAAIPLSSEDRAAALTTPAPARSANLPALALGALCLAGVVAVALHMRRPVPPGGAAHLRAVRDADAPAGEMRQLRHGRAKDASGVRQTMNRSPTGRTPGGRKGGTHEVGALPAPPRDHSTLALAGARPTLQKVGTAHQAAGGRVSGGGNATSSSTLVEMMRML
mmetsp:Transcript_12352/g.36967  ORF Transcript_12352/g.36967 Transcript_12352/m.36967 type:complete len:580 (+) Transcript_12352:52-1791(+)